MGMGFKLHWGARCDAALPLVLSWVAYPLGWGWVEAFEPACRKALEALVSHRHGLEEYSSRARMGLYSGAAHDGLKGASRMLKLEGAAVVVIAMADVLLW